MENPPEPRESAPRPRQVRRGRKRAPGRPTIDDAAQIHARILEAALEEFLARGFGAASVEGIARAARVNKDTIYRQFGTKEALYRDSVRRAQAAMGQGMRADLFAQPHDVVATLGGVMRHLHRTFTTPQSRRIVSMSVTQAALFPDLAASALTETRDYLQPLEDYLDLLHRESTLRFDDAQEAAHLLATVALGGVRFLFESTLSGPELDRYVERRLAVLLRGWDYRSTSTETESLSVRTLPLEWDARG